MKNLEPVPIESLEFNPFRELGSEWALATAGNASSWNTMTVAWGGFGVLWEKNSIFCVVRPTRYTFEFMEKSGFFTLSFFPSQYRDALLYCGSHSGRDVDKAAETGLTPVEVQGKAEDDRSVSFEEARIVYLCRKVYAQDFEPRFFLDENIASHYPEKDYHRLYVGEIVQVFRGKSR